MIYNANNVVYQTCPFINDTLHFRCFLQVHNAYFGIMKLYSLLALLLIAAVVIVNGKTNSSGKYCSFDYVKESCLNVMLNGRECFINIFPR